MPVTLIDPGPTWPISQGVEYALPNSPCNIVTGVVCQRSNTLGGTYTNWVVGPVYNHVGGFIKCVTGNTTIKATKLKMKEMTRYSNSVILSSPSNYWRLNETTGLVAKDVIGGANGTIPGGTLLNGESGVTINSGPISIGNIASLAFTGAFSTEFWIKYNTTGGGILGKADSSGKGWAVYEGNGKIRFWAYTTAVAAVFDLTGLKTVNNNQWHHVVCSWDGAATVRIHIDGVLDIQTGAGAGIPDNTNTFPFMIGGIIGGFWSGGQIDEVAIYPRALTPAEILSHYKSR